jgi:hypothetical protein
MTAPDNALQVGHDDHFIIVAITPEGAENAAAVKMTPEQTAAFVNAIARTMQSLGTRHRLFAEMDAAAGPYCLMSRCPRGLIRCLI